MTPQKIEQGYMLYCNLSQRGLTRAPLRFHFPCAAGSLVKQTDLYKQSTAASQDAQAFLEKVG